MSTDAARTKLRELIATKQQWLRQWQAPELLSPGRSDMIQVLSDNIAELQQVLAELGKAEPQEPAPAPAPMPPFPPVSQWKRGCAVCGLGADGEAYGYACPRSDCPTRVTCGGVV